MTDDSVDDLQGRFRVLDLQVDLGRETVSRAKQAIDLPELSFRLFAVLIRHAPHRVSKDELITEVWNDVVVSDETLAQRVRLLRQALGEDSQNPRYFSSVRGRGYRMICEVKPVGEAPSGNKTKYGFIGAALVAVTALLFFNNLQDDSPPAPSENSIAVLPFADLSASQDYGYFADGMQEELLSRLTDIGGLDISSRTSVAPYRYTDLGIPEIAERLGVSAIIEGSVRIDGDRVRITVQLIDAQSDQHLWADNFDSTLSVQNIFSIQEEVATRIAEAMQLEYMRDAEPEPVQLPTGSLDAYSAYLLGRYHTFRQTPDDLELAVANLERATTLDPEFAEAFASLGWAYSFLGTSYGNVPPREVYPQAKEAALNALALDSDLADARTLYADILTWYDWDFDAAEREYKKTLQLDPLNVLGYALFLGSQGRHVEAIELIERRIQAQPDDIYVRVNAAWRFLSAGQYERALEEAVLAGNHPDAPAVLGWATHALGDTQGAIGVFESDLEDRGRLPSQLSRLAIVYFLSGRDTEASELLAELEAIALREYFSPALLAEVYFAAGDVDNGFVFLQRAVDARAREMIFLQVNRSLNDWHDDPRYLDLVKAIGFPSLQ
ncbi:MAG: winged helix-turn-helix domain-containing protein [Proteobacteria bacterium]|nr:winged helix-turn-helix domain-containing protein [Pseudomonadota bacterium]